MSTINKRLFEELFVKKSVNCNKKLYVDAFNFIWPCKNHFEEFLTANEFDVKLNIAKKIYKYYQTIENSFMPSTLINSIIYLQQHHLARKGKYIPQDHVVHSINLYILGIYVFFNNSIFQHKLIESNTKYTQNESFIVFLKKWTLFALYHDVGYVFESLVDNQGYTNYQSILEKYEKTKIEYVNQLFFRSLSNIIFDLTIISRSTSSFNSSEEMISYNDNWLIFEKNSISNLVDIKSNLSQWDNYLLLNSINDYDSLSSFFTILDNDCVIVVKDKSNYSIAFLSKRICYLTEKFYKSNPHLNFNDLFCVDNIIKMHNTRINCYINNPKSKVMHNLSSAYSSDIETFNKKIPENLLTNFSFIANSHSINSTICQINNWIEKESGYIDGDISFDLDRYEKNYSECISIVIRSEANKKIELFLKNNLITAQSLQKKIDELSSEWGSLDKEIVSKEAKKQYDQTYGISSVIFSYLDSIVKKAHKTIVPLFQNSNYFEITDNKIEFIPFRFDVNNLFAKKIYDNLVETSNKLSINFDELISYHTNYSTCDHGVVSASILFDIISILGNLVDYSKSSGEVEFSWARLENISELIDDKTLEIYSDSIFSILLHNIYTKKSNQAYGIDYKHNIDSNPFCYFCALLDVLQKWDRAKSIDFSVLDLPSNHYLGQDYDLIITNDELRIICSLTNNSFIKDTIDELEDYLPGVKNIIKVTEIEI